MVIGLDDDDREPRRQRMDDFKIEKDILQRSKLMVELYGSFGVVSKNGVENSNCSYFANMCVYMSCSCVAKMSFIAGLVFLIVVV